MGSNVQLIPSDQSFYLVGIMKHFQPGGKDHREGHNHNHNHNHKNHPYQVSFVQEMAMHVLISIAAQRCIF